MRPTRALSYLEQEPTMTRQSDLITSMLEQNQEFAAHRHASGLRMMPSLKTLIIGCVDPRVDPMHVLGLEAGEAAIVRNVGGRITPSALDTLTMLREVTRAAGGDIGAGWNIIILHHTDCGITRLGAAPHLLARFFGVEESGLPDQSITDPRASVALDVKVLRKSQILSDEVQVTGLVYDVATGRVERVG